jgi:hypothetical protein
MMDGLNRKTSPEVFHHLEKTEIETDDDARTKNPALLEFRQG